MVRCGKVWCGVEGGAVLCCLVWRIVLVWWFDLVFAGFVFYVALFGLCVRWFVVLGLFGVLHICLCFAFVISAILFGRCCSGILAGVLSVKLLCSHS